MHGVLKPSRQHLVRGLLRALLPGIVVLPQFAAATPATRSVEFQFKRAGEISVAIRGTDIQYVEFVRHVFDATKSAEVVTSEAQYLVAESVDVGDVERTVLPRVETEDDVVEVPVAIPVPLSIGAGEYCEVVEATVIGTQKAARTFNRRSCFVVDDTGAASMVSPAELTISQPTVKGFDSEGKEVLEFAGTGIPYARGESDSGEVGFDALVDGAGTSTDENDRVGGAQ